MTKRDEKETEQDDEDSTSPSDDARDSDAPASKPPAAKGASKPPAAKDASKSSDEDDEEEEDEAAEESNEDAEQSSEDADDDLAARQADGEEPTEDEEHAAATQLGHRRYVMTAFMFVGAIGAYVAGRTIFGVWTHYANRDFFALNLPSLAAIPDDRKEAIAMVIAGIIAFFVVIRLYRKPDIQQWSDEVASEMSKVKWPTRKEVTGSTIVVIAASAAATLYLFMLDRFWGFVTNLVYGTAS